jgi:RNA polymerase sigma-70 factor (ECF subfamily)
MNYRNLSDDAILVLFKDNDADAFKEIYLRYWKQVYQVAYKKLQSKELAEEVTQNLFVDLWKRRDSLAINNLSAYLFGSLKFAVINYFKSLLVQERYQLHARESLPKNENTDYLILLHDLSDALNRGIDLLPKKTAEVFRLSRINNYSVKDISKALNISEKAVEYHITQSLKTMRYHLKEYMILALLLCFWL